MNSLYQQLGGGFSNNAFIRMFKMLKSAQNPQAMLQSMVQQNPQMQSVMQLVNQNGGDAKTAFYNLAKQRGVDPEEVLKQLR